MSPPLTLTDHRRRARVQQLNGAISATARRLFQSPGATDLTGKEHPELRAFVTALALELSSDSDPESQYRTRATVRRVFHDRDAQWLTRSALHSGATALLCDQLLRSAEDPQGLDLGLVLAVLCDPLLAPCSSNGGGDASGGGSRACIWRGRKPAFHAMPCFSVWDTLAPFLERVARRNPTALRETLDTYTLAWQQRRRQQGHCKGVDASVGDASARVNCKFAQVVGLWRLMETLSGSCTSVRSAPSQGGGAMQARSAAVRADAADAAESATIALLDSLLQFLVRTKVLESVVAGGSSAPTGREDHEAASSDAAHFDDLLMDKFFSRLQEFLFECPHSERFTRHAMQSAIVDCIRDCAAPSDVGGADAVSDDATYSRCITSATVPAGFSVFAAASSVFIKGLAEGLVSSVRGVVKDDYEAGDRERTRDERTNSGTCRQLRLFLVGFCAHVNLVPIDAVLDVFSDLMELYGAAVAESSSTDGSGSQSPGSGGTRVEIVRWIVYVAVYRTDAMRELSRQHAEYTTSGVSEDAGAAEVSRQYLKLLDFQGRFTGEVESQDFFAMPVEWMAVFWREWFGFMHDDIASFVRGYEDHLEFQSQTGQLQFSQPKQELELTALEAALPIRTVDVLFVKQAKLLGSHLTRADFVDRLLLQQQRQHDASGLLLLRSRKKRRRFVAPADPAAEERKLNVLLLSETMERVCSFMSAKRLCRLASVCRAFAEVSRSDRLWRQLFSSLLSREDVPALECRHEPGYTHDWRSMYRERYDAQRRLRRKKQRASRESILIASADAVSADRALEYLVGDGVAAAHPFAPQLCRICGCSRLLTSESQRAAHMKTHELFKCSSYGPLSCDAAFPGLAMLKKHRRQHHDVKRPESSSQSRAARLEKPRIECGFGGCTMSYTSLKRLATHRQLKNHQYASNGT
ncbi:hypothetical protein PybrP1_002769 [[Pythium] brassicae (nom. inval.)]|nr:hypothetical protein PybrP1_002769 [[Pythium] brassicae (nom. inval.)]